MKYVIIGGGIAGATLAIFLQRKGFEVVIAERLDGKASVGHGFLIHKEAISVLEEINLPGGMVPGESIHGFRLFRPDGVLVREELLDSWSCMRRDQLMDFLNGYLAEGTLHQGLPFTGFIRNGNRVVAAEFEGGRREEGDIFIGADGARSLVRQHLFGKTVHSPVRVKEIVGVCSHPALAARYAHSFLKFQHSDYGLSFGMIPTGPEDFVWFIQYDPTMGDVVGEGSEAIAAFCRKKLKGFPDPVTEILDKVDFRLSYVWHTRDFDPLPAFHQQNVVLLGDAAQQVLPFTSAGTTNALLGAKVLADGLTTYADPQIAFRVYYEQRALHVKNHVQLGRQLTRNFLRPEKEKKSEVQLPFLPTRPVRFTGVAHGLLRHPRVRIQYFTDPVCSTCWIVQPALRKIIQEYGRNLNISYHMGGLLPSWETIRGSIRSPEDAARHWEEAALKYQMPINPMVWKDDPLSSSFPPSIAFKAAQRQDEERAVQFLRRLREMLFLDAKNIARWQHLATAAEETGLDWQKMLADFNGEALQEFRLDLRLARSLGIVSFPTLILTDAAGNSTRIKGYFEFRELEAIILGMLAADPSFIPGLHRTG
ncbi:DsbA family protein [Puia sp.]|jgi:2-polyprenyl-6-methoxyphenol hydroxylase-like FAD-dependent oxidoreductase/protein-disulfide isomerase-like protein with CxxC motif|uniref:DsbA family protein n=1 Tax=Puia sp. TaxID=2045100 RepID=UPI002F3F3177